MQRGVGSIRVTARGTRFVSPAGFGRQGHPLARAPLRISTRVPRSLSMAVRRDPLGAIRRAARSMVPHRSLRPAVGATLPSSAMHWDHARRSVTARRSWCARTRSG